jgi:hypothetical protein
MLSKRFATMLLSGAALAGLGASAASASLLIDLRAVTLNGSNNLGPGNTPKLVQNVRTGDTVGLRVFADVTGSNALKFQTLQALSGSFLSTGVTKGNLVLAAAGQVLPFNAAGSSVGQMTDLDGDGDLDIGSNNPGDPAGFWAIRSSLLTGPHSTDVAGHSVFDPSFPPTAIPGGTEYTLVNNLKFVVTQVATLEPSRVNFRTRASNTGGFWSQDANELTTDNGDGTTQVGYSGGVSFSDTSGVLSGSPVLIGIYDPEPSTLGLAAATGLTMLARRRR